MPGENEPACQRSDRSVIRNHGDTEATSMINGTANYQIKCMPFTFDLPTERVFGSATESPAERNSMIKNVRTDVPAYPPRATHDDLCDAQPDYWRNCERAKGRGCRNGERVRWNRELNKGRRRQERSEGGGTRKSLNSRRDRRSRVTKIEIGDRTRQ